MNIGGYCHPSQQMGGGQGMGPNGSRGHMVGQGDGPDRSGANRGQGIQTDKGRGQGMQTDKGRGQVGAGDGPDESRAK